MFYCVVFNRVLRREKNKSPKDKRFEKKKKKKMIRLAILVVLFLVCFTSSYASNEVDVEAICKKSKNPSFCDTLLKSKPGGVGGDLGSLAEYTIDVIRTDVSNTLNIITKLIEKSDSDPMKQKQYKNCLSLFGMEEGALGEVEEALQMLKKSDYNGMNMHMTVVMTNVNECLGDSEDSSTQISPELSKNVGIVDQVAQIILIISNMFKN
ncbi:pectinesterase inhibitor 2-like [Vicia villosa]|uniref:pectinesterase inhibitor 2-like n=1 Tax=Vicia villosa TaxID=3911 RepID=UPI00273B6325|nr:pectinesterase inhibitor 2-like [Vicia villosa]